MFSSYSSLVDIRTIDYLVMPSTDGLKVMAYFKPDDDGNVKPAAPLDESASQVREIIAAYIESCRYRGIPAIRIQTFTSQEAEQYRKTGVFAGGKGYRLTPGEWIQANLLVIIIVLIIIVLTLQRFGVLPD